MVRITDKYVNQFDFEQKKVMLSSLNLNISKSGYLCGEPLNVRLMNVPLQTYYSYINPQSIKAEKKVEKIGIKVNVFLKKMLGQLQKKGIYIDFNQPINRMQMMKHVVSLTEKEKQSFMYKYYFFGS